VVYRVTASDLREAPLRRASAAICSALLLLTVLTASLFTASASSAATTYPALRCRGISHRGTYVVVRGHQRTVVVRARQCYARGRDRLRYRAVKRTYGCVVLRRVSSRHGCVKPVTTRTVRNLYIRGGTHDVTYSQVRFEGYTGSESADWTCVGMAAIGSAGSISNITFERCVFATVPAGVFGNAFHMWNTSTVGSTISNITFRDCWFEPQPRMQIEMNGFGGWWHDVTIDHCTFEPGGGEMVSVSMSPVDGAIPAPYGVTVGGVVRGVEGLRITGNDFRGTGVTVNGFAPKWEFGFEFACVFPYARDKSIGRSEFSGNRVGRCGTAWYNFSYGGARGMTFADNVFDWNYNPAGTAGTPTDWFWSGTTLSDCRFTNNTYILPAGDNKPWQLMGITTGNNNTFSAERWTKPSGTMGGGCNFDFADSTYTDCDFQLSVPVRFPASASGTGCVFQSGHTGGQFH
jgi:hypothetical protein